MLGAEVLVEVVDGEIGERARPRDAVDVLRFEPRVRDRSFGRFGTDLTIEIISVAGLYSMVSTVLIGFDVPTPNGEQPF